jgi:hypothetical protein
MGCPRSNWMHTGSRVSRTAGAPNGLKEVSVEGAHTATRCMLVAVSRGTDATNDPKAKRAEGAGAVAPRMLVAVPPVVLALKGMPAEGARTEA